MNQNKIKLLAEILSSVKNPEKGLPKEIFLAVCKIVPMSACELVLVNSKKEILLTFRKDRWWEGWHFPGGLLRLNESFKDRLTYVAKNEIGIKLPKYQFIGPINYQNTPRGHDVSLVFLAKFSGKIKHGTWFKTMPKNIIPQHKQLWQMAKKALK